MSFRFRRSVRIIPGVRLNLSKSGISVSLGGAGATLNLSSRGSAVTVGLPGTGLAYRHQLSTPNWRAPRRHVAPPQAVPSSLRPESVDAPELLPTLAPQEYLTGEIRSAEVMTLTSPDLAGLKALINEAVSQKRSLGGDLASALAERNKTWVKLRRREQLPLRLFYKKRLTTFRSAFEEAEGEALKVIEALALSEVRVQFDFDEQMFAAQKALEAAHGRLSRCARIWDVTSLNSIDRYTTRSLASSAVTRTSVSLMSITDGVIAGQQAGLRFQNANGADLDFFPGFLLMRGHSADDYALIDLRELEIDVRPVDFVEDETVPHDTNVIGYAWAKSNKDGSPDRRFSGNHQIPIVRYGRITFATSSGLAEAYQVSNWEAALAFGQTLIEAQRIMRSQRSRPGVAPVEPHSEATTIDLNERLPALPHVSGAHGLTAGALVTVSVAISGAVLSLQPLPNALPPAQVAALAPPAPAIESFNPHSRASHPSPSAASEPPVQVQSRSVALSSTSPQQPLFVRERLETKQGANVRAGPERGATVLKSVGVGTVFQVFGRQRDWVHVGDEGPLGWVHNSLLKPQI